MMEGRKNISCIWATAPSGNIPAVSEILSMSSTPAQDRARSEYEKNSKFNESSLTDF